MHEEVAVHIFEPADEGRVVRKEFVDRARDRFFVWKNKRKKNRHQRDSLNDHIIMTQIL